MDRDSAIAEARSKRAGVREHKRVSRERREQAKRDMRDLERFCKSHRIEFVLEEGGEAIRTATPPPREANGGVTKLGTLRMEQ